MIPASAWRQWITKRSCFTEEQIVFAQRQAEGGTSPRKICRKLGVSEQTFYRWEKTLTDPGGPSSVEPGPQTSKLGPRLPASTERRRCGPEHPTGSISFSKVNAPKALRTSATGMGTGFVGAAIVLGLRPEAPCQWCRTAAHEPAGPGPERPDLSDPPGHETARSGESQSDLRRPSE
jgi:transposase-like protein